MKRKPLEIADIINDFLDELREKTGVDAVTFVIACRIAIRRAIAKEENKTDEDDNKESGG